MTARYLLALDQGTTSSRAIVFDRAGRPVATAQREFPQHYPAPGWVEHDPEDLWRSQLNVAQEALSRSGLSPADIAAAGIANQRETTIVWDRDTGEPVYNAIVWQDRRTAVYCEYLRGEGWEEPIRRRTGLVIDPYFSATKLHWILQNVPQAQQRAEAGRLLFGTVDTYLIWRLTGGRVHVTDYSNASRTMLFDIHACRWDEELLRELNIPPSLLPEARPSSEVYGEIDARYFGAPIKIAGAAGDQQAATFGQTCFQPGMVKNTYGTGNFVLMNTGDRALESSAHLLTTIAWNVAGMVIYALEGSIFVTGAAVQWLRDELRIIVDASETETLARRVPGTGGVYFVPAFAGLGAPYWDARARGLLIGLTRGARREHIVRATLEAVAYQSEDVLAAMRRDSGLGIPKLRVDGGMAANDFLMQLQADISRIEVERPSVTETTALGAAYLAGLAVGFWESQEEIARHWTVQRSFGPQMQEEERERRYRDWKRAVERARDWAQA